jgi:hypothetical protein
MHDADEPVDPYKDLLAEATELAERAAALAARSEPLLEQALRLRADQLGEPRERHLHLVPGGPTTVVNRGAADG